MNKVKFAPTPEPFSVSGPAEGIRWKDWTDTFNIYLAAIGCKNDEEKANMLLLCAGKEVQRIYKTLTPAENTYKGTVEALDKYFSPNINKRYERFLFNKTIQAVNETTDNFVTRLKNLATTCQFNDENDVIIDKIIMSCNSTKLRQKLLAEDDLNLEKVTRIARSLESSALQAKEIEKTFHTNLSNNGIRSEQRQEQVNKITKSKFQVQKKQQQYRNQQYRPNEQMNQNKGLKPGYRSKECYRCGQLGHHPKDRAKCPASDKQCSHCDRFGHFSKMCLFMKASKQGKVLQTAEESCSYTEKIKERDDEQSVDQNSPNFLFRINSTNNKDRIMVSLMINGKHITMQVDTAADVSVMSEEIASGIPDLEIKPTDRVLKDFNNKEIQVVGEAKVSVQYQGKTVNDLCIVIVKGHRQTLLGIEWLKHIKLDWKNIFSVLDNDVDSNTQYILEEYKEVFEQSLGTVKHVKARLALKPDAHPKFLPPRTIPFAIKPLVEREIKRLVEENIWEKVTYSDWATPLVPVMKSDGNIRLCGDYKVTLNPQLQVAQHPLPNPTDMFATLSNCTVFSKIDLRQAFQQLEMDEKSQEMCSVNTHMGLYRPKRLPYGVASSPAIWQQTVDKVFAGLPGVVCFVDDILVAGKDKKEHSKRLKMVLQRILDNGIRIQKNKCSFEVSSVEYLGFVINGQGIHKTDDKVRAIKNAKTPENVKELQSFLGLVTFYGRFIPNLATIAHPLYQLLNKDVKWNWTEKCQVSFDGIKAEITAPNFLVHFQPELPIKLVCDASQVGIGSVLAHILPDGIERPIAYASRVLNQAERNYSQIEKEALALIYGVKKFHMYLYGKNQFTLVTDHKPLLAILGPKAGLPTLVAARLQRWSLILAAYNYTIEYRPTTKMGNADALSRLPVDKAPEEYENTILLIDALQMPVTAKDIAQHTKRDPTLSKVLQDLTTGRDAFTKQEDCKPYREVWSELSTEQECVLRGSRVVIPKALRKRILEEIHSDHQGIVRSKAIARTYVWWPGIDKEIESSVKECEACALQQNNPQAVKMHPWECPRYPWQRLHIDFAGPFLGHTYLIVIDAYSKWPEIVPMQSTTTQCTIKALMKIFATHGLPERIVSDNGPQFTSMEFREFLEGNGISHSFSAPYHPATNGEAERFVQSFKKNMKCRESTSSTVTFDICKFLLAYRTTPHATTGLTPSSLLMNRRIKNKLDLVMPNSQKERECKGWKNLEGIGNIRTFSPASKVLVRQYNTNNKWVIGTILEKLGTLHYNVDVNGILVKKHVDQIREYSPKQDECNNGINSSGIRSSLRGSKGKPPDKLDL